MIVGVGSDLVEIDRISSITKRTSSFVKRILTENEQAYLTDKSPERVIEYLAGRFAAKEAIAKALGTGIGSKLSFQDMEIIPDAMGKPTVQISQRVRDELSLGDRCRVHVSISHSRTVAIAYVVIEQM